MRRSLLVALALAGCEDSTRRPAPRERAGRIVVLCASWAAPCQEWREHLEDTHVRRAIRDRRIAVEWIDVSDGNDEVILEQWDASGVPSVILIDATDHEVQRFTMPVSDGSFAAALERL